MSDSDFEARLRAVEDRLAIIDLIAGYGPAVDNADADEVARMWAPDGQYRFGATTLRGAEVPALVDLPQHREYLAAGCGHILTTPRISLDGDRALAVNHSMVLMREGARWIVDRTSANRWELERVDGVWRVLRRTNALLDGDAEAAALLRLNG